MNDPPSLRPATPEEIEETLSFALRFKGRSAPMWRVHWWRKSPLSICAGTTRHHRRPEDEA